MTDESVQSTRGIDRPDREEYDDPEAYYREVQRRKAAKEGVELVAEGPAPADENPDPSGRGWSS